jgi:hypothetical protein
MCRSYFLFEFTAGSRLAATTVTTNDGARPALDSWFSWDVGWMRNVAPSRGFGASLGVGGSGDGTRLTLRARHRSWLRRNIIVDASAGPLIAQLQHGGQDGVAPTWGATADLGLGRARLGLATLSADIARQRGTTQLAVHAGGRVESAGVAIVSAIAAVGGLIVMAALRDAHF